jgi:hypothetical protein
LELQKHLSTLIMTRISQVQYGHTNTVGTTICLR